MDKSIITERTVQNARTNALKKLLCEGVLLKANVWRKANFIFPAPQNKIWQQKLSMLTGFLISLCLKFLQ